MLLVYGLPLFVCFPQHQWNPTVRSAGSANATLGHRYTVSDTGSRGTSTDAIATADTPHDALHRKPTT